MRGVYAVFLELEEDSVIEIGALGEISFQKGVYVYIGSAMNSLEARVSRHFSSDKSNHWHIDYFTGEAEAFAFAAFSTGSYWECILAETVEKSCEPVQDFGSSDCSCDSHLFRIGTWKNTTENVLTPENSC
jgi:Uri superfamily endonuclease